MNEMEISILKQKVSMLQKLLATCKEKNSNKSLKIELRELERQLVTLQKENKKIK